MAKANVFTKAKENSKSAPKKDEKLIINVKGTEFAEKLQKFATLKSQIDELEAELAMSQDFVKTTGIDEYSKLIESKKINIGSFIITADNGSKVMFLPTKKYIRIDEAQANILKETYGDTIVDENTIYQFNNEILLKNMDAIAKLIEESDVLSESDKNNLIEAKTAFAIEKDALDRVYTLSKESGNSVKDVLIDIQPVYQLKGATIKK